MRIAINKDDHSVPLNALFLRTFLPVALVMVLVIGLSTRMLYESELTLIEQRERALLERSINSMQKNLDLPYEHLLSLREEQPIRRAIQGLDPGLKALENSFASLLSRNNDYFQVRWIDETGQERIRLQPDPGQPYRYQRTPDQNLQNKQERYYFQQTRALDNRRQVYISPLDLNVEFGQIERPLRPTVRMATQLWLEDRFKGIIIINIDASRYLQELQLSAARHQKRFQLISPQGAWISHPNADYEWGFLLNHSHAFSQQSPTVWQSMQNYGQHQLLNDEGLWSWISLYPGNMRARFNDQLLGHLLLHQPARAINRLRLAYWGSALLLLLLLLGSGGFILRRMLKAQRAQQDAETQALKQRNHTELLKKQREDEQRFRVIFNASHSPILVCDSEGMIVLVNPAVERLFGYSAFELTGLPVEHLIPVDLRKDHIRQRQDYLSHLRPRRKMMKNGESLKGLRKDGQLVDVEIGLSPYEINGEAYILATLEDISARIESERRLQEIHERQTRHLEQAKADAERLAHLKSYFLANMSHEIRTPLNAIMVLSELLGHEELPNSARLLSKNIHSAGENLLRIVNDVLDFSKIEAGGISLEQVPFRLQDVLSQLLAITEVSARQKRLKLYLNTGGCERLNLLGDPHRLAQVLLNLTSNAIKFTHRGKINIRIEKRSQSAEQVCLRFSITDTGPGIPHEQQTSIFDAFAQADSAVTRQYGGTGLGLTISRQLVDLMGGEMMLESDPGKGSCFSFTLKLPLTDVQPEKARISALPSKDQLRHYTLLVVDDSDINRDIARRIIESAGGKVLMARDGQDALQQMSAQQPPEVDLVLMDLQMPVMDGYQATQKLHQLPGQAQLPVVALTAGITQEARDNALAAGAVEVLTKPFTIEQILHCIHKYLPVYQAAEAAPDATTAARSTLRSEAENTTAADADPDRAKAAASDGQNRNSTDGHDNDAVLFDQQTALSNWGDMESLQLFLQQFADKYGHCAQEIDSLIQQQDFQAAGHLAHKVKGAAASLYLNALRQQLHEIEHNAEHNPAACDAGMLQKTFTKTLSTINMFNSKHEVSDQSRSRTETP